MTTKLEVKDYPEVVVNPELKGQEKSAIVNGLSEDIRKAVAAGDLDVDLSDVAYADKTQQKKFVKFFVRTFALTDAGIALLSSLNLPEGKTAEKVRVTFYNAGDDAQNRSKIRQSIVDGIAGPSKTLDKAGQSLDNLSAMDNVTPEMLAALEAKFAALKAKVSAGQTQA